MSPLAPHNFSDRKADVQNVASGMCVGGFASFFGGETHGEQGTWSISLSPNTSAIYTDKSIGADCGQLLRIRRTPRFL